MWKRNKEGRRRFKQTECSTDKWVERWIWWERLRGTETAPEHSVVGWQSTPPEATAIIKAVIEWTHIFISYWFISNSPLISGGHRCTVAFLLPRLRSSAPPDITVVITALPPRKLFTVSYRNKNWMSILEEKSRKEEREEKTMTEREKSKTAKLSPTGVPFDKTQLQWPLCYFCSNCQSAQSFQSCVCMLQTFPPKVRRERRVITSTSNWADDSMSSLTNLEDNARVRKRKLTVHYTLLADDETSPKHYSLWLYNNDREVYVHTGLLVRGHRQTQMSDMMKHM